MMYQHEARGADQVITKAIGPHVQATRHHGEDGRGRRPGHGELMAANGADEIWNGVGKDHATSQPTAWAGLTRWSG